MAKRKKPTDEAIKIFKSKWMIGANIWLFVLLMVGVYEVLTRKSNLVWLILAIVTVMLFNWGIYMENLSKIEDEMYGRKK